MEHKKLTAKLSLDNSEFKAGLRDSERMLHGFATVAASGLAIAGTALLAFTATSIKMAIAAEGVVNAFKRIGDPTLVNRLKEATRGTFDEDDLKRYAIRAQQLGISFKDLTTYLKFATNQAIIMGKPVKEMADFIINAVGRNSSRGMYQIGIATKEATVAFKEAGGFAELINRRLGDMGDVAETTGIKIQRLASDWNDVKQSFGQSIINSEATQGLLAWLDNLSKAGADPRIKNAAQAWKMMKPNNYKEFVKAMNEIEAAGFKTMPNAFLQGGKWEGFTVPQKVIETLTTLKDRLKDEEEALDSIDITNKEGIETQKKVILSLQQQIKELEKLPETAEKAAERLKKSMEEIAATRKRLDDLAFQYGQDIPQSVNPETNYGKSFKRFQNINAGVIPAETMTKALQAQSEAVNILSNSFAELFSSTGEGFKGMINEMIAGIERLVAELLARAAIFGILTIISGGTGELAGIAKSLLGGRSLGQFVGGVGTIASGAVGMSNVSPLSNSLNINLTGGISGRDWKLMQQRNT